MTKLDHILLGSAGGLMVALGLMYFMPPKTPLQAVHERYNHITVWEDGSYKGETVEGQVERGCIKGGLCNE